MYKIYLNFVYAQKKAVLNCETIKAVAENLEYYSRTYDLEPDEYRTTDSHNLYFDAWEKVDYGSIPELPF